MAKNDFLDELDEVVEGADLQSPKKKKVAEASSEKPEMMMKNLKIPRAWNDILKAHGGGTVSGYMVQAIREKMVKDGLL